MNLEPIDKLVVDNNLDIDGDILNVDGRLIYIDEHCIKQLGGKQS